MLIALGSSAIVMYYSLKIWIESKPAEGSDNETG